MTFLPKDIDSPIHPPVKIQGSKTKLVDFISSSIEWDGNGRWVEPFMGTGTVAFNLKPYRALLSDINPHVVDLFKCINLGVITAESTYEHLISEGRKLNKTGPSKDDSYYYEIRDRFNDTGNPLDFLLLNRTCFNGIVRFNSSGEFNVPFCREPDKLNEGSVNSIADRVRVCSEIMSEREWEFLSLDWRICLSKCREGDFVYLDPPYIGRNTGYFNTDWSKDEARELADKTKGLPCGSALSMWKKDDDRFNKHIPDCWDWAEEKTTDHFYSVGASGDSRGGVVESLLITPGFSS